MKKLFVFILKMNVSIGGPDIEIQFELLNQQACYTHFLKQWACYAHCRDAKTQILFFFPVVLWHPAIMYFHPA